MSVTDLPIATDDLDRAVRDLEEHGYCLIADALTNDEVSSLRQRLVQVAEEERADGAAFFDSGGPNQRVWQLLNKGDEFLELAAHRVGLAVADRVIGIHPSFGIDDGLPAYLLGSMTANIAGPGGTAQLLHADDGYMPLPRPAYPVVMNIAWMLDDVTEANGATRIVPGSHRMERRADQGATSIPAEGAAGTALMYVGSLWHGTGANTTPDQKRHVILHYFTKPWIRTQENHPASLLPAVRAKVLESPVLRRLLGFDLHHSLGMINGVRDQAEMYGSLIKAAGVGVAASSDG